MEKQKILDLLQYIVSPEDKWKRNSYTIGEDGKLYRGGEYANIQYDTRYLLWRLDLPYDDVCDKINMVRCNPNCMKSNNEMYIPMPVACIDGYFYFRNTWDITYFITEGDSFFEEYAENFPLDKKYWVEDYEKRGELHLLFLKLREYYRPFNELDIAGIKKILDKIDSIKFLESIHGIFVYLLEKSKGDTHTSVKSTEFAINKRISEVKDGETFIDRLIDQSKKIFVDKPEFKPKNDIKYYLNGFVSDDEEKSPLTGVYHDGEEGYAVASDGFILAAVSYAYNENIKGKLIYPNGEVEEVKYPNWKRIIPEKKYLTKIDYDINLLWEFIYTLDKQNKIKAGSLYDGSTPADKFFNRFGINIGGEWVNYAIKYFLRFISLANRLGNGHLYYNPNKKNATALYFITDEEKPSYILVQPCMAGVEYEGNTIVADHYHKTYCLYEFFYDPDDFRKKYEDKGSNDNDDYKASKYFGLKVAENKDELERGINEILSQYASREMASNQAINYMDESPDISKEWLRENGLKSRNDFKRWAANRQSKVRKPILEKQEKELMEAKKTIADIHVANILKKAHEEAERWDREHNEDKKENDYFSLSEKLADLYKAGLKLDIQKSKAVAQSMGISITDSELMQACETSVVIEARRIADSEMSIKDKYFKLVDLYGRQVTVQPKDTYAMSLQQYSTPCPIAYLLGVYVNQGLKGGIDEVCYEPTAGNGLLTIALDPKKTVVNELDKVRYENLKRLGFAQVTNYDISKTELAKNSVAGIIMNPPFDSLDKKDFLVRKRMVMGREGVFTFERLDHKIAISVLEMMRDNGRAAIIIGGKMAVKFKDYKESYWKDGAIYGQYRTFINYLNRQYNVEDVIYLNGDLYRKQGTTFPIVVILINGRTPWNFSREHQWHTFDPVKDSQIDTFNEFFIRMEDHLSLNDKIKVSEERKRALALLQLAKAKLALAKANEK